MAVMKNAIDINEVFSCTTSRDLRDMILGDCIAEGSYRVVFQHATDPTLVVKMEKGYDSFNNTFEYNTWNHVKDTEFAKWFAPITLISSNGRFLIQKKTKPIVLEKLPKKVPVFMSDIKPENWGLYKGKPVCHDYAFNHLMERGMTSRLKKAYW